MKKAIINLYCFIDDFTKECAKELKKHAIKSDNKSKSTRIPGLAQREMITIILLFQQSPCRNFKFFYHTYRTLYKGDFLGMPSYEKFIALMPKIITILTVLNEKSVKYYWNQVFRQSTSSGSGDQPAIT
jgi:hypothetical protein